MKDLFDNAIAAVTAAVKAVARAIGTTASAAAPAACVAALCAAAVMAPAPCRAQTGTFVTTRPTLLWSGTLTTNNTSITVYGTNFLNYSGFHRPQLIFSEWNTNGTGSTFATATVTAYPIPYFGSQGFTNQVFNTNMVIATTGSNILSQACTGLTTNVDYGYMDWSLADSIAGWQFIISYPGTNKANISVNGELDLVIAP